MNPKHCLFRLSLMIGIMLLTLTVLSTPSISAENHSTKAVKKTAKKVRKCWRRVNLSDDVGGGDAPICIEFENVLNTTCTSPEKLKFNWTLPFSETRFKKVIWHPLDWREYWWLITDYFYGGKNPEIRKMGELGLRRNYETGKMTIAVTTVDIDNNGAPEEVVRIGFWGGGGRLLIINPKSKKNDNEYRNMIADPNRSDSSEIMLYDGQSYMFAWDDAWKLLVVWQGISKVQSMKLCQFKYENGGKKK
jgi:hypothetical protein